VSTETVLRFRPGRRPVPVLSPEAVRERSIRRRVGLVWGLLFLNVLTFYPGTWNGVPLLLPIPHRIGQLITQGSLPLALLVALSVNRRRLIRPSVYMCLLSLIVIDACISCAYHGDTVHLLGTLYRTARLAEFVITLWLLTPWWGRRDMLLIRSHVTALSVVLGSVLLGLIIAPGRALSGGRLAGMFWPMPPTNVADFAAVALGLVMVLWLSDLVRGGRALLVVLLAGLMLILTHSRTELIAMAAGVLVAGLSLFMSSARVRRFFAVLSVGVSIGIVVFSGLLTSWLVRGEQGHQLTDLTGRTTVWSAVIHARRDLFHSVFGNGLSNNAFNGLPIDSNWIAAYWDLGFLGVAICAALLLFVLVSAYFRPRSPQRALAVYLAIYLLVRSITETGLNDVSVNLLELTLAASLLVSPALEKLPRTRLARPPTPISAGTR
jgi:hypothetical protein